MESRLFQVIALANNYSEKLVEDNMGLVRAVVYKFFRGPRIEDSELYSAGCVGLVHAARTYDSSKSKFSTWATRVITQHVINELRRKPEELVSLSSLDEKEMESCLSDECLETIPDHLVKILVAGDDSETESESENRKILVDFYMRDRSFSEIGRKMGISREAVRKKAQKAISQIRLKNAEILKEYMA